MLTSAGRLLKADRQSTASSRNVISWSHGVHDPEWFRWTRG